MRRILNPALRFEINLTANISSTDNASLHWPAIAVIDANRMVHAVVLLAGYNLGGVWWPCVGTRDFYWQVKLFEWLSICPCCEEMYRITV